jgi:hypothetical protein
MNKLLGSHQDFWQDDVQRAAKAQHREAFPHGDIKTEGADRSAHTSFPTWGDVLEAVKEGQHLAMLDHHALRCASRSRGVHHIRQVLGCHSTAGVRIALLRHTLPVRIQAYHMRSMLRQHSHALLLGHQHRYLGVCHHAGKALWRIHWV